MDLSRISETLTKLWQPSVEAYIASPRYCRKHFNAKYKKLIKEEDYKNYEVVTSVGMCEKCHTLTQVHYLNPMLSNSKVEE